MSDDLPDGLEEVVEENYHIKGANLFNGLKVEDQSMVLKIYHTKEKKGEFKPESSYEEKVEEVAKLYHAQKCAFQDVLTKEGFEIISGTAKDYDGRIAALTAFGTLIILGKPKQKGRHIYMNRIHSPEYNLNNLRGNLLEDPQIGKIINLIYSKSSEPRRYNTSNLIALAVNPRGADGDELESAVETDWRIHTRTMELLIMPDQKVEQPVKPEISCKY